MFRPQRSKPGREHAIDPSPKTSDTATGRFEELPNSFLGLLFIAFWPWIIIVFEYVLVLLLLVFGCEITAAHARGCTVFGLDYGAVVYPLWTLGYQVAFSFIWVLPASVLVLIVGVVRLIRRHGRK